MTKDARAPDADKGAPRPPWTPSLGLFVAITPAIAYAVAFQVEKGWAEYFGYPPTWIRLEFIDVLIAWLWLIVGAVVVFVPLTFFTAVLPSRATRVLLLLLWRPAFGLAGALIILRKADLLGVVAVIVAAVVGLGSLALLSYAIAFAVRNRRPAERILDSIERHYRTEMEASSKAPFMPWPSLGDYPRVGTAMGIAMLALITILILFGVPELLGALRAKGQRDFATLPGPPSFVLLRRYSDAHVAQQLDSTGIYLEPVFKLIPIGDSLLKRIEMHHFQTLAVRGYHLGKSAPLRGFQRDSLPGDNRFLDSSRSPSSITPHRSPH